MFTVTMQEMFYAKNLNVYACKMMQKQTGLKFREKNPTSSCQTKLKWSNIACDKTHK